MFIVIPKTVKPSEILNLRDQLICDKQENDIVSKNLEKFRIY